MIHCFSVRAISRPTLSALARISASISHWSSDSRFFAHRVCKTPRVPGSTSNPGGNIAGRGLTTILGRPGGVMVTFVGIAASGGSRKYTRRRVPASSWSVSLAGRYVDFPGHETSQTEASEMG